MRFCTKALLAALVAVEVRSAPWLDVVAQTAEHYVPGSTGAYPPNPSQQATAATIPYPSVFMPTTDKATTGPIRQVRLHYGNAVVIDNYLLLVITEVYSNPCSLGVQALCGMAITLSVQEAGSEIATMVKLVEGGKALTPSGYTLGLIDVTPDSPGQPLPAYDATITYVKPTGETVAINTNLVNWKLRGSDNYKYSFENHSKKVASLLQEPATVTVSNDRVVNATFPKFPTMPVPPEIRNSYPTINKLFETIKAAYALEPPAAKIEIDWDTNMNYPTKIFIDYKADVADDEFFITATNLKLLPRTGTEPKKEGQKQQAYEEEYKMAPEEDKEVAVPKPTPNPNKDLNANTDGLDYTGVVAVPEYAEPDIKEVHRTPPNVVLNAMGDHNKIDVVSDLPDRAPPVPKGRPPPFKPEVDGPQVPELPEMPPKKSGAGDSGGGEDGKVGKVEDQPVAAKSQQQQAEAAAPIGGPATATAPASASAQANVNKDKGKPQPNTNTPAVRFDHGTLIVDPVEATLTPNNNNNRQPAGTNNQETNKQQRPAQPLASQQQQQTDPLGTGTTYDKPMVNPIKVHAPQQQQVPARKRLRA